MSVVYECGTPIDQGILEHLFRGFPTEEMTVDDWKQVCSFLLVNIKTNDTGLWDALGALDYNPHWQIATPGRA